MKQTILRYSLLSVGLLATGLGIVGIFVPLLPTTPFLLLAAACFARSSERFHTWLIEHNHLGPLVRGFLDGSGIPRRARRTAIALIWLTLPPAALLLVPHLWLKLALILLAVAISAYLLRLPTREEDV